VTEFDGRTAGLITLQDIPDTASAVALYDSWPGDDRYRLLQVEAGAELMAALQMMEENGANHAAVIQNNHLVGLLSREQVLRYLRLRAELGV
jgi:predicted transcriptional regulator